MRKVFTKDIVELFIKYYRQWYKEYINDTIQNNLWEADDYILDKIPDLSIVEVNFLQEAYRYWIGKDMENPGQNEVETMLSYLN